MRLWNIMQEYRLIKRGEEERREGRRREIEE